MNKIIILFLLISVVLSGCKVREVTKKYEAAQGSTYTIYNKTYSINKITVEGSLLSFNAIQK